MSKLTTLAAAFFILAMGIAPARTWTSSDGRTLEADYVSSDDKGVSVRVRGGQIVTITFDRLSEQDRNWVAEKVKSDAEAAMNDEDRSTDDLTGEWLKKEEDGLQYRLYGGKRLRGKERYPLLIYLHGRSGNVMDADDVYGMRPFVDDDIYRKQPCIIFCPQSPDGGTQGWGGNLKEKVIKTTERLIRELPVDKNRVYLAGFSMGAWGSVRFFSENRDLFTAGVLIAGGGNPGNAEALKTVPLWVFFGDQDDPGGLKGTREMVAALEALEAPVKYTEMKDKGHNIHGDVFKDEAMHEWLFEQVKQ